MRLLLHTAVALFALCSAKCALASDVDADLLQAARGGDLKQVEQLIAAGANVNVRETRRPNVGRTPLHYAAGQYNDAGPGLHLEVARLLLGKGADVNAAAEGGYTPLHVASGLGHLEMAELLLSQGANPNAKDRRGPPLMAAVVQGHLDVVRLLLRHGADVDAEGELGRPIDMIGWIGSWYPAHDAIFLELINSGADLAHSPRGRDTLLDAIDRNRSKVAVAMIVKGAPISALALEKAGERANREVVDALIRRGAKVFTGESIGGTLLRGAACQKDDPEFFEWVLARTPDVNARGYEGGSALHRAANCANTLAISRLIARRADVNQRDDRGTSPINSFYLGGQTASVRMLLDAGANPNDANERGSTVLMSAAASDDAEMIRLLVMRGADVNLKNRSGETALHLAARLYRLEAAAALLEAKDLRIDEFNGRGETALHIAATTGGPELVTMLLKRGASKSLRSNRGKTALEAAEEQGRTSLVELLR